MPPNKSSAAPYAKLGRAIEAARLAKKLSRRELGDAAGYRGGNTGITVNKIEKGELRPDDERLHAIADTLGIPRSRLDKLGERVTTNPAAAAQAAKRNRRRIDALNERTAALQTEVENHYAQLEQARARIEESFLVPFLHYAARLDGAAADLDDALTVLRAVDGADGGADLTTKVQLNLDEVAASLHRAVAGYTAGGLAAGTAVGGGAAYATYTAVAAFASASTGTAISSLAGVAASNATLAALGGGSLAAGGMGVAGGTAVLAGIVALPALVGAGVALFWTSKKWAGRARDDSVRIDAAEDEFDRVAARLTASFGWTTGARTYLGLAESTAAKLIAVLAPDTAPLPDGEQWQTMTEARRQAARLGLQLAGVVLTVLPLPAMATPDDDLSDEAVAQLEDHAARWNAAVLSDATARTEQLFADAVLLQARGA